MANKERNGHFFHVTHNKFDNKWHVKEVKGKEGEMTTFDSKEEAVKKAESLAKKVDMGHVVIHNERGRFEVIENFEAVS
ncbi:MAG: hypothetical protein PG981_000664 [Wolbachia endosymbiont of Ctenocephalides orientis wCori]|nr:MAG: hypothetical protein PG981_000664 [Wolbachia endosymbiont of Ctenocephalides orientis wCori]